MTIVDADTVQPTNMNRQLPAMHSTLGMPKAEVLAARYKDTTDIELPSIPLPERREYSLNAGLCQIRFYSGCHRHDQS